MFGASAVPTLLQQYGFCRVQGSARYPGWISGTTSSPEEWSGTGIVTQGGGGVTIPTGVPEPCRCGTWGHSSHGRGGLPGSIEGLPQASTGAAGFAAVDLFPKVLNDEAGT